MHAMLQFVKVPLIFHAAVEQSSRVMRVIRIRRNSTSTTLTMPCLFPRYDVYCMTFEPLMWKIQAITAAATSHWQSVASLLTQFASSLSLKLPSLNLPPVPSIACFSPNKYSPCNYHTMCCSCWFCSAEPPLKAFSVVNSMNPPNDAPDPHVPVCRDPNQPLESSVNPPPLLSRQILKYDFAAKMHIGLQCFVRHHCAEISRQSNCWGAGAALCSTCSMVKKCFFACFRGCLFAILASSCHSVQRLIIWQVRAI
jgi:hypothetical protein